METKTTISGMIKGNQVFVPDYQRAYSWDTGTKDGDMRKHVNVFLSDLEDYLKSEVNTPYYFGHFLFEEIQPYKYAIIDGQQRLTTISIFLSAIFSRIKQTRELDDYESILYEDLIKRRSFYAFSTVQYDNQLFRDYVIDEKKKDRYGIETTSGNRIADAYDYFRNKLSQMEITHLEKLLEAVTNASCTTHIVKGEADAIQMFIFQNNRGKKPSHLEIIKAQFMYNIYIYGADDASSILSEVKGRFEHIYRSISNIENFVDEDDVLNLSLKVFYNSLWESNAIERVNEELNKSTRLSFIQDFTLCLENSFNNLARLNVDKDNNTDIEGALLCGRYDIVLPFFIKAYINGIILEDICRIGKVLGDLVLRDAIIKTRADLRSRLNDVFSDFKTSVDAIENRINWMKATDNWWWAYWGNDSLKPVLEANWLSNYHGIAKILLWKYENYLITNGKSGYSPISYKSIASPHLEHIAPQTENGEKEAAGYDSYDDDFRDNYLLSLGNFLLLSAPHNESIGNKPFSLKRSTYDQLKQQREVQDMSADDITWDRIKIAKRKEKIIQFVIEHC